MLQLDQDGSLRHFLAIDGLPKALISKILDTAQQFAELNDTTVKKVPLLSGITVANLFFEPSTRTRTTFEIAAKRLGADVINFNINSSATKKGESLIDTLRNLEAMYCDLFVVRHNVSGAAHFIAQHTQPHVRVVNGGDGCHAHPTQALLDMLTIQQYKGDISQNRIAIVGDILHSRVARSQITALRTLQAKEIRIVAPKTLLPQTPEHLEVPIYHDLKTGLKDIDVIIMLRLQNERMANGLLPSKNEYFSTFGLTPETISFAKEDVLVMHPGPINRGVELSSEIADGPNAVILKQVSNGIALRMAVMSMLMQRELSNEVLA